MKECKNARNCCYGCIFEENKCGYEMSLTNEDECPIMYEEYEMFEMKLNEDDLK